MHDAATPSARERNAPTAADVVTPAKPCRIAKGKCVSIAANQMQRRKPPLETTAFQAVPPGGFSARRYHFSFCRLERVEAPVVK
jgi:hypothetical protein